MQGQQGDQAGATDGQQRVVVVTQDGMGVAPHHDSEDGPTTRTRCGSLPSGWSTEVSLRSSGGWVMGPSLPT